MHVCMDACMHECVCMRIVLICLQVLLLVFAYQCIYACITSYTYIHIYIYIYTYIYIYICICICICMCIVYLEHVHAHLHRMQPSKKHCVVIFFMMNNSFCIRVLKNVTKRTPHRNNLSDKSQTSACSIQYYHRHSDNMHHAHTVMLCECTTHIQLCCVNAPRTYSHVV